MCSKQVSVLYAVCRIQITRDKVKEHNYGQLADIFVHFQSQKYVEMAQERTTKLKEHSFCTHAAKWPDLEEVTQNWTKNHSFTYKYFFSPKPTF